MSDSVSISSRKATPQDLFTEVAPFYDLMNAVASLGREKNWRLEALTEVGSNNSVRVLDLCCGTGAMAHPIRARCPRAVITGVDINSPMLEQAKVRRGSQYAELLLAPASETGLVDSSFDLVTMSFCFHDLAAPARVLDEAYRLLRPGGQLLCLELTLPESQPQRMLYLHFLALLAKFRNFLGLQRRGHLIDEILESPPHGVLVGSVRDAGFCFYGSKSHGGGVATSYLFTKPEVSVNLQQHFEQGCKE